MSTCARLGVMMVALLWGTGASADVVRPPPTDCVPGSEGTSGHSGPYCYPSKCGAGCKDGKVCESRKLCIVMKTLGGGRRRLDPPPVVESVVGSCDRGKTCASGACKAIRVCVAKVRKTELPIQAPVRHAGCGCSLGAAADGAGGALLAAALLFLACRRRRAR